MFDVSIEKDNLNLFLIISYSSFVIVILNFWWISNVTNTPIIYSHKSQYLLQLPLLMHFFIFFFFFHFFTDFLPNWLQLQRDLLLLSNWFSSSLEFVFVFFSPIQFFADNLNIFLSLVFISWSSSSLQFNFFISI